MGKFIDLTNRRFEHWTVLCRAEKRGSESYWICKCDCGRTKVVVSSSLRNGTSKSCGCKDGKNNEYFITGNTVRVKLTNSEDFMLCDKEDWEQLKNVKWYKDILGYAACSAKPRRFHNFIINNNSKDKVVDHINRNRLDNRKCNLRLVSFKENVRNSNKKCTNKSGVKGVWYDNARNKWCAGISVNGTSVGLGRFDSIEEACLARKNGEIKYWGCINGTE